MTFIAPYRTLLYSGIFGLMYVFLSAYVVAWRVKENRVFGQKDDHTSALTRAVRIHGNFSEYVPFILLLMALDEMTGREVLWVHVFGCTLLVGRLGHFLGLRKTHGTSAPRAIGIITTLIVMLVLSVLLLWKSML